jgi:type III restriction enzyme
MIELDGQLEFAEPHLIFEYYNWNIAKEAKTRLEKEDFDIQEVPGQGFTIDLEGNKLQFSSSGKDQFLPYMSDIDVWEPINLIHWLDRNLKQPDISQPQMVSWLQKVIEYLIDIRKISLTSLVIAKFALLNKLQSIITEARKNAREKSFALFQNEYRKTLDYDTGFEFKKGMYDLIIPYTGRYKYSKHFLGNNQIGPMNNEEAQCAQVLDAHEKVKYWHRNIENKTASFKLPTSTDYFYPDFVALLTDDRILVVEYKGAHIASSQDTKEKEAIGLIWEKQSNKLGLFIVAELKKDGKTLEQQIKEKIEGK